MDHLRKSCTSSLCTERSCSRGSQRLAAHSRRDDATPTKHNSIYTDVTLSLGYEYPKWIIFKDLEKKEKKYSHGMPPETKFRQDSRLYDLSPNALPPAITYFHIHVGKARQERFPTPVMYLCHGDGWQTWLPSPRKFRLTRHGYT
jgi:hypothetical protein